MTLENRRVRDALDGAPVAVLAERGIEVRACRSRVLRASQFRPVIRYDLRSVDPVSQGLRSSVVIGKGYLRGGGAETFDFMQQLWQDGFGPHSQLTIPEPVAWVGDQQLLLQGRASGRALYDYLDDLGRISRPVRLTARWLAKLHAAEVTGMPDWGGDEERDKIGRYAATLAEVLPADGPRIRALADEVVERFARLDSLPKVVTHGDFQPKNIYVARNCVTVIDFDRFAASHPGRDVGHFVGQCMTMSYVRTGSFDAIARWNAEFLEEYARHAAEGALAEFPVFLVRTFLEILYYKLFVRPVKDPSFVPAWIAAAEGMLASRHFTTTIPPTIPGGGR